MNVSPMRTNQTHRTLSPSGGFVVFAASLIAATVSGSAFSQSSGVRLWGDNSSNQCTAIPAALTNPTRITGGNYHTIALDASGTVFCWGRNTDGQSNVPAALGVVQAIAGGSYHSVALKADGTVACWGPTGVFNSITNPNQFNQCAVPAGLTGVTAITAGWKHTLVLKSNGSIVGWGTNDSGQLTTPTDVGVVSKIAAGSRHNLVLRTNGTVRAWGRNVEQQAPSLLSYTNVTAIAAGASHSIALIADGTLRCWGNNLNGQCNGSTYTGIVGIAAGSAHTVALKSDGTVVTFGLASSSSLPTNPPLSFATGIGSGGLHTAAITLAAPSVVVVSTTPTTCRGNMGAIDATVTNATTTTWTGPNGFTASTVDLSNIFAGNYVLTATGAGGTTVVPVTVVNTPDITLPVVASYSTSLTAAAGENCTVPVANFAATIIASDNCTASGALVITQSPAAGSSVGLGLNTVVITVRDDSNNQVSVNATFNVTGHSTVCYRDFDTDTFGNPAISGFFCIAPLGYVANGDDCDDGNSFVHPGQSEQCNDDDDDCDYFVDEDLPTYDYYIDVDHDGFGDGRIRITVCSPTAPAGYVTDGTDCNDANATVYPGAVETCANIAIDNDCDGSSAESEAIDRVTFYADADTDGAGDPAVSLLACSAPADYVANSNDQCPTVHDLIEKAVYYRDFDGDGFGDRNTLAAVCSTTAPAGQVAVAGDCDDAQFLYADNDGDTYGAGQPTACGRPSNTDCNDTPITGAAINPGAAEVCDVANTDENCNNLADNDDSGAADAGKTNFYRDADNDTFSVNAASRFCDLPAGYEVAAEGDCNDTPITGAAIYPGAPELCADSTVDNNCNGVSTDVDTNAADTVDFYSDQDGDGYSINVTAKFCAGTTNAGYVATLSNPIDCNDTVAAINPGATEVCDVANTDENCNNFADNDDIGAADAGKTDFYSDADNDTYSVNAASRFCDLPAGYEVAAEGDCNDNDAAINPGAVENCANILVDDDCDGDISAAEAIDSVSYYVDGDQDGFGSGAATKSCTAIVGSVTNNSDCDDARLLYADNDGDTYGAGAAIACGVQLNTDCNDANPAINPGAAELCADSTVDNNCNLDATDVDANAADKVDFWQDTDGDTYTSGVAGKFCPGTINAGYRPYCSAPLDCNDNAFLIHPGAVENCANLGIDNDCDDVNDAAEAIDSVSYYTDADSDNYGAGTATKSCSPIAGSVTNNTDCNDTNAAIRPGAAELCADSTIDNNCNGVATDVDTNAADKVDFYRDQDGDTYSINMTAKFCAGTTNAGYVATLSNPIDCDDNNAAISPGAVERCNSIDDNCNGQIDDGVTFTPYYRDADNDGFGNPLVTESNCTGVIPTGFVSNSTDCNDGNAAINPGAAELCADSTVDNNCNGVTTDVDVDAADKVDFFRDQDLDTYSINTTAKFCTGTINAGWKSTLSSPIDCNDLVAAIYPGAAELCTDSTVDNNCNGITTDVDANAPGKVDYCRDEDGDGYSINVTAKFCPGTTNAGYLANCSDPIDCDDTNGAIYPGAPELCADSTIDNNCNAVVTDVDANAADKVDFFRDQDLDTYSINVTDKFCPGTTNPGWKSTLSNPIDCNDLNAVVYPGAVENCANLGTDNDCDGSNAESEAIDLISFYADTDLDGCGDPANSANACSVPAGYVANSTDGCPADGAKCSAGTCGCGVADTDSDSDGTADCNDGCPNDANKTAPGTCGCGVADTDSDGDGTANCNDGCPNDSNKTTPGTCGCGVADTDSDGNGSPDCADFVLSLDPQCIAVRSGNTLCVQVASTWPAFRAPDRVTGVQLAVEFDATRLRLDDVVNAITGGPFDLELDQRIDNTLGTLRYAAGINLNADPVAPGMTAAAPIVNLNFTVLDGLSDCSATGLVELVSNLGVVRTKFSTESAGDVVVRIPVLTAMPIIALDFAQPVIEGLPAAISIPTDAGVLTGGTYAQPTVTATDICDSAADLSMLITYPDSTTSTTWPANDLFPNNPSDANGGISTVVYTAVDDAGNTATATLVVTVGNFQHFNANITLGGTILGNSVRPIVVTVDGLAAQTVEVSMVRANGSIIDLHVPIANGYGCTTARDRDHSLAQVSATAIVNREYATSFTLRQGNSNNDSQIDIFDFSLFVVDRSTGTSSDVATNARSNFNADTLVTNADFGFLTLNFFEVDQTCGGNVAGASSAPVSRVSIKELRRRGLGNLAVADINGDGWVDLNDVQLYMQGAGQAPAGVDTTRGRPATRW